MDPAVVPVAREGGASAVQAWLQRFGDDDGGHCKVWLVLPESNWSIAFSSIPDVWSLAQDRLELCCFLLFLFPTWL